ncbi:hypothetical protein EAX61_07620 [Dokdonia sinensis]|uniref:Secreted protein n=1 Tax=Dokdonia sinensis TaxID=2479847 RepID=A0A3M0GQA3_9FLAO|nr:hypothetical protein [Dokdonia sinensis]RMB59446.1 hypothetical protein EAX61_07620 [Dokdonia sinensis]
MKSYTAAFVFLFTITIAAQESPSQTFWNTLQAHCGKAYEGKLVLPEEDEAFGGKKLVMHVRSCDENQIKIPFFVGDDKSRTWILTMNDGIITLKHDHRHEDGTEDEVNFYGGTSSNTGKSDIQFFPADVHTQQMIPGAATNVWWITVDETSFTYNLKRLGTDRIFKVVMDLTKEIETPGAPWGWED